jgi:LacI family transcriptional regulator
LFVATIRDVAREAGVSIATVSRVFNQTALVTESTARHVRAVATRMDYWPNSAARSLITHRTHAIGVLLPDLYGEFFSEVIRGIDRVARREKYQVLISSSHANAETIVSAVRALRGRIDGLIVMAPDADATAVIRDFASRFPVVLLNAGEVAAPCCSISVENFEGAYAAVRHLASLGHTRIAMLTGPPGNLDAEQRRLGYRRALADAGLELVPELELPGDFSELAGFDAAAVLARLEPRPTAVFAANDYMAIGLISALRDADVRLPQEMAVVGFDDIAIAQYLSPALTTVHVNACALGEQAMERLMPYARERRPAEPHRETLATSLIVRASCGAHPIAGTGATGHRRRHRALAAEVRHGEQPVVRHEGTGV